MIPRSVGEATAHCLSRGGGAVYLSAAICGYRGGRPEPKFRFEYTMMTRKVFRDSTPIPYCTKTETKLPKLTVVWQSKSVTMSSVIERSDRKIQWCATILTYSESDVESHPNDTRGHVLCNKIRVPGFQQTLYHGTSTRAMIHTRGPRCLISKYFQTIYLVWISSSFRKFAFQIPSLPRVLRWRNSHVFRRKSQCNPCCLGEV